MAKRDPRKQPKRAENDQVFYEFPGAVPLGLTVTELPAITLPRIGRPSRVRTARVATRIMLILAAVLLSATAAGGTVLGYYWLTTPRVPSVNSLVNKEFRGATIYDRNGAILYNIGYGAAHQTVKLSDIPPQFVEATIAAEDSNFYHHHGVDLAGIGRAALADIQHKRSIQGGSTITQQLVKNTILSGEKSFDRKLKEAVMASKVEHAYTKQEILTVYLNQIFYGQRSWGVADAAKTYFAKPVKDLSIAESSMLAGIPVAPTVYSPLGAYPDLAISRQAYVLGRMRDLGYITPTEEAQAKQIQLAYHPSATEMHAPHFVAYVRELLAKSYSEQEIEQGGFKIYTTLDLTQQELGERLVSEQVANLAGQNVTNGSLVSMNPKTGEVLAMVGSANWDNDAIGGKYNVAVANRQPGSALKPFTYLAGFQKGMTAATVMHDKKTDFGKYIPKNYDGKYRGNIPVRLALQNSLNIPAVEALRYVGIPDFLGLLHGAGISTLNGSLSDYGYALTLGGGEVKLLDLTGAYGMLADGGVRHDAVVIQRIVDGHGKTLVDNRKPSQGHRVVTPELAYYVSNILSDNASRAMEFGTGSALHLDSRTAAAKTGTTDDFRDAWTFGYTPDLVVGTWVGNNNNAPMGAVAGALGAAPIWHDFMESALAGTPAHDFIRPAGIVTRCVNRSNGLPTASASCGPGDQEIFIESITPVVLPDTSVKDEPKKDEKKPEDPKPAEQPAPVPPPDTGRGGGGGGGGGDPCDPAAGPCPPPSA